MGFNFGAFLGGMAQGAADSITAKEEELSRIRLMDAEAATRERLAKNAERREENKRNEENVNMLKSLGYSDAQASWILKGGTSTVSLYSDFATKAMAKGIDPKTVLDSSLINSDQQDPRNESALLTVNREMDDASADIFEIQTGVLGEILGEGKKKPKEYATLQAGHAAALSRLHNAKVEFGEGSDEYNAEQKSVDFWKKEIAAAEPETKNQTEWFSKESRGRIVKDALSLARQDLDFTVDMDGNITSKLEGREGPSAVAKLNAAASIEADANIEKGVVDQRLLNKAERLRDAALTSLSSFGRRVASKAGQEDKILKKFGYFKTQKSADGTMQPTNFLTEIQNATSGRYKVGDVVLVKQKVNNIETIRIKVYTGIATSKVEYQGKTLYDMFHDAGEYTERN
tara:strand:+ start:1008 stop:2210 length:1203 start_codon:yes stop_codon:yes gene_type:complete